MPGFESEKVEFEVDPRPLREVVPFVVLVSVVLVFVIVVPVDLVPTLPLVPEVFEPVPVPVADAAPLGDCAALPVWAKAGADIAAVTAAIETYLPILI